MQDNPGRLCTSFVLSPYFSSKIVDITTNKQLSCDRLSDCISLSRALAILPVSAKATVPGPGYIDTQNWFVSPLSLAYARATGKFGIQPDRFSASTGEAIPGFANYFFADGHVETITADQISQWLTAGKNFLIPEQ
jgi:prepilin-type processing-associated H-X9-DG protein